MDLKRKLDRLTGAGPGSHTTPAGAPPGEGAGVENACLEGAGAEDAGAEDAGAEDAGAEGLAGEPTDTKRERVERLRSMMGALVARGKARRPESRDAVRIARREPLPGHERETPGGLLQVIERYLEPHHCHGRTPVAGALRVDPRTVAKLALDPGLEGVDFRRMMLLDTETTGLAGGTGTIPFLVGMAWFEDESLRVEQLLLRRPGEEAPMLARLAERLEAASCIVSYNGKSFDWPLVRTRFVLNRVPMPSPPAHLDLLHCARRVYKRRMESVRLVDMESEVLGFRREDDVEGWEIPNIYLRFLRMGETGGLASVIEHNANDLIALAALLHKLAGRFDRVFHEDDPRDHLSYAIVAQRAGDAERARVFARAAAAGGGGAACTVRAWMLEARLAFRRGDTDSEEAALLAALGAARHEDGDDLDRAEVHLALAKLYEHRRKDPARALEHAMHTALVEGDDARARRRVRLRRRLDSG